MLAALSAALAFTGPALLGTRARRTRMDDALIMAKPVPKVPFKYPGMDTPQWVDVYNRMYRERIMFLGQPIGDQFSNTIIAVLLYLEKEDRNSPVQMYMNVPGGVTKAGLAMHDAMNMMPYEIQTVNMGICAQIGTFLCASGSPGKRFALPNARFVMQNPRLDPPRDREGKPVQRVMQATEMQLEVSEVLRDKKRLLKGLSQFTGRSVEMIETDFARDFYLDAEEAKAYGLIDQILLPKRQLESKADISSIPADGPMPAGIN